MRTLLLILATLAYPVLLSAQETRTEVVRATTAFHDSKPNSDTVLAAYAIEGQFERVEIVRLKYQTDLLAGLEASVKQHAINNAVILSGIGSVRSYHYHVVSNRTFPSRNVFVKDPSAPADIVNVSGYVIDGRVHAHVTFAHPGKAFGGHLESGTEVFTFAIVTIGVLKEGSDLRRVDDKTYR